MEGANNNNLIFVSSPSAGSSGGGGESSSTHTSNRIPIVMMTSTTGSAATPPVATPVATLSLNRVSPITGSIWSYTGFLGMNLFIWVVYLLLPKAFRKQFCRASRRRYIRRKDVSSMPAGGYWLPASKANSVISGSGGSAVGTNSHRARMNNLQNQQQQRRRQHVAEGELLDLNNTNATSRNQQQLHSTPERNKQRGGGGFGNQDGKEPPSPEHPALKRIPPNKIIAETMGRLQGRGIRLMAHGVQCDPKRVWIKLDDETTSVTWQTEFPRRVPNQAGGVSIVLMRGSLHRIALCNVLYIDVGRKTKALMRQDLNDNLNVQDTTCFSLLTQNGSLDLQANSRLERDALVACFSMILDDVHTEDWRSLYEASPDPSLVTTTTTSASAFNGAGTGDESSAAEEIGTEVAYNSDLMVEV